MQHQSLVRQNGATLIVGLIIVVLISIIGLSAIRGSGLQEQMAGNMRDRNIAFQAGEAGVREGEAMPAKNEVPSNTNASKGFIAFDDVSKLGAAVRGTEFWRDTDRWEAAAAEYKEDLKFVAKKPKTVLEELRFRATGFDGSAIDQGSSMNVDDETRYRITSKAVGGSEASNVIIQSTYR